MKVTNSKNFRKINKIIHVTARTGHSVKTARPFLTHAVKLTV